MANKLLPPHAHRANTRANLATPSVPVLKKDDLQYIKDAQGNLAVGSPDPSFKPILDQDGHVIGQETIPSDDVSVTGNTLSNFISRGEISCIYGNWTPPSWRNGSGRAKSRAAKPHAAPWSGSMR